MTLFSFVFFFVPSDADRIMNLTVYRKAGLFEIWVVLERSFDFSVQIFK